MQGPPGTGKTFCIISALYVLVAQSRRILVCSSSNHAVDLVARKIANDGVRDEKGEVRNPNGNILFFVQRLELKLFPL